MAQISSAPFADFMKEAMRIMDETKKKGIILRLIGACAITAHCSNFNWIQKDAKRDISDIDFMTYGRFFSALKAFFAELGYVPNERFNVLHGSTRQIYHDTANDHIVEVFVDALRMCHLIDFKGRLELDYPTITLADLLLEKMQIVKLNKKDAIDTIMLLREHEIGEIEKETINAKYISKLLSDDWGFYYTVTMNLKKIRDEFLPTYSFLKEKDQRDVKVKISELLDKIEKEPKSFKWRMRAKIGTKKLWYTEVGEKVRGSVN